MSDTTTTIQGDAAYNNRLATSSDLQMIYSEEHMDFWRQYYKPLEEKAISLTSNLLPVQADLARLTMQNQMEVLPLQTAVSKRGLGAQYDAMPAMANATRKELENQAAEAEVVRPVGAEYYKQALKGVDVNQKVNQARSDIASGFATTDAAARREAGRLGLNPNSGRTADRIQATGIDKAKAIGGAMSSARNAAEKENFTRLQNAILTSRSGVANPSALMNQRFGQ